MALYLCQLLRDLTQVTWGPKWPKLIGAQITGRWSAEAISASSFMWLSCVHLGWRARSSWLCMLCSAVWLQTALFPTQTTDAIWKCGQYMKILDIETLETWKTAAWASDGIRWHQDESEYVVCPGDSHHFGPAASQCHTRGDAGCYPQSPRSATVWRSGPQWCHYQ